MLYWYYGYLPHIACLTHMSSNNNVYSKIYIYSSFPVSFSLIDYFSWVGSEHFPPFLPGIGANPFSQVPKSCGKLS